MLGVVADAAIGLTIGLRGDTNVANMAVMGFVGSARHPSFGPARCERVSLERFWDEVAWQRRAEVTETGTRTTFLSQHQWGEGTGKVGCGECAAIVRVSRKDPEAMSLGELQDRVVDLAEARARLDGEYLAALGELASRSGAQGAAPRLRDMNRMTAAAARSDARPALELKEQGFSDTIEAMRAGEINAAHARVVAREAPKKHLGILGRQWLPIR